MEKETKNSSGKYDTLLMRLDDFYNNNGVGMECMTECIGNLIANNVLLSQIANGKTVDYAEIGDIVNNVYGAMQIVAHITGIMGEYKAIINGEYKL